MELDIRRPEQIVPSYSLTGDLLSYQRCRLQYRYHNGSALPPSRPIQLWFGEFIHQTLEMCYQYWKEVIDNGATVPEFPWPCTPCSSRLQEDDIPEWQDHDIGRFAHLVEQSLQRQGKQARSDAARDSAYGRIESAVNELGPHLFPLISAAEQRVIGTRPVPHSAQELRCDNYQVHGVIDVLTHVTISSELDSNPIVQAIRGQYPDLNGTFEVIVDYKGTRRPLTNEDDWNRGAWQILTYAWLRQQQPDSLPIAAGILIYINELLPSTEEMNALRKGIKDGIADVYPSSGSMDESNVRLWKPGASTEQLSSEFRLRRAIRIVQVDDDGVERALAEFDDVVRRAEEDIVSEADGENILTAWAPNCKDAPTCSACDFRYFCPNPTGSHDLSSPLG